jgi:hypothetical protein
MKLIAELNCLDIGEKCMRSEKFIAVGLLEGDTERIQLIFFKLEAVSSRDVFAENTVELNSA